MTDGWFPSHTLQMFLQSAEMRLLGTEMRQELDLSCGLSSIARGTCTLRLRPVDVLRGGGPIGQIEILADRPLMRGEITLPRAGFDILARHVAQEPPRPVAVIVALTESLEVNLQGDLRISKTRTLSVADISFNVPLQ
ncbi:MAG: hypothetical protein ACO3BE_00090 [Gemmobacter sp.]